MNTVTNLGTDGMDRHWLDDPQHRAFLAGDALSQFAFFRASLQARPGFALLDLSGRPIEGAPQEIHSTARMVHCYAIGRTAGVAGADRIVDHGMDSLWSFHRDATHGGYFHALADGQVSSDVKLAYGHAFVLLAGSTARIAGHPDADRMIADVSDVLFDRFWDDGHGLFSDEFTRDWTPFSTYRGMNSNMHAVEALLAAFEATGEALYLDRAGRILDFFTGEMAPAFGWRIPEHYSEDWQIDRNYAGDPIFRPAGTTPGHSFEFARLLLQYWDLAGRRDDSCPVRARHLFETALTDGSDAARGGIVYTVGLDGAVLRPVRYAWPVTEAIGAAAALLKLDRQPQYEAAYRNLWRFADRHLIDHEVGGWVQELDDANAPSGDQFAGKPDIYHSLQAALFPLSGKLSRIPADLRGALAPVS